jgi:hypothetical protein
MIYSYYFRRGHHGGGRKYILGGIIQIKERK